MCWRHNIAACFNRTATYTMPKAVEDWPCLMVVMKFKAGKALPQRGHDKRVSPLWRLPLPLPLVCLLLGVSALAPRKPDMLHLPGQDQKLRHGHLQQNLCAAQGSAQGQGGQGEASTSGFPAAQSQSLCSGTGGSLSIEHRERRVEKRTRNSICFPRTTTNTNTTREQTGKQSNYNATRASGCEIRLVRKVRLQSFQGSFAGQLAVSLLFVPLSCSILFFPSIRGISKEVRVSLSPFSGTGKQLTSSHYIFYVQAGSNKYSENFAPHSPFNVRLLVDGSNRLGGVKPSPQSRDCAFCTSGRGGRFAREISGNA